MSENKSRKQYCYDFPRPALSVDVIVFRREGLGIEVLLIKRRNEPFRGAWSFPGGFVEEGEALEKAAEPAVHLKVPVHVDAKAADNWEAAH